MQKSLLLIIMALFFGQGYAQNYWNKTTESSMGGAELTERAVFPTAKQFFSLDLEGMKAALANAPGRENFTGPSGVIVDFPDGNGQMEHFRIYEASVMHPDLAAMHPKIKSYVGQGVEHPAKSVRFSVTLFGLHSMMFSPDGTSYIDTYTKDLQNYIVYKRADLKGPRSFGCQVFNEPADEAAPKSLPLSVNASDGLLRTYRLAMACTIEYAAFHINAAGVSSGTLAEKKAAVLAAMNVTMTRVNGVYERDMAITMQIVPNNENIIFVTSDNLDNDNANNLISQIQNVVNSGIGFSNYDIGHVVSTGAGGLATLGCVCTSNKARGVTGSPAPVGDPYDIDYVAHEMGHQFGASHTFNNSFQRNAATAVEPGSGSTIMAYAGISPPNVQNNSDDYFHVVSISEMTSFISGTGGTCAVATPNGNAAPQVSFMFNMIIPKATAFVLRGEATDADGDVLTYCWEQTNANGSSSTQNQTPSAFSTSGPNYRSLPPSESPDRYMPQLQSVLAGNLTPTWEVTPSVGRTLNFALTVRDNQVANGGQTGTGNMNVIINNTAGPFRVTSQNIDDISWDQNTQQTITWDVAGTTGNGVNTNNVNILLSTDGGQTFDTVLAANTPNDGSQDITVPDVTAGFCRIMIEAVGNIFYAVNDTPFAIGTVVTTQCDDFVNNESVAIPDAATSYSTATVEVPEGGAIESVEVTVDITHSYIGDLALLMESPQGTIVPLYFASCNGEDNMMVTFSDEGAPINCASPTTGIVLPQEPLSAFTGEDAQGTWTLYYADGAPNDTGTLNSWSIEICRPGIAAAESFATNDFTIYPNPNNGQFTISFTSATTQPVAVNVYDMRGRSVYAQEHKNTGTINASLNLQGLEAGVYLVSVNDGAVQSVKKIVIQ